MIKAIWWIVKHIIWGGNFEADFSFLMNFEEASEYLKKGYFIYQFSYPNILYVMIDEEIYTINTKNKKNGISNTFFYICHEIFLEGITFNRTSKIKGGKLNGKYNYW